MRRIRVVVCAVALLAGCAQQSAEMRNAPRKHVMVHFTDSYLAPNIAHVLPGGSVGWVNYASEYDGTISFTRAVAANFTCTDLRPIFSKTGGGVASIPVTRGGMENVVTPCALKPGEYDYTINLFNRRDDRYSPTKTLSGRIVVGGGS